MALNIDDYIKGLIHTEMQKRSFYSTNFSIIDGANHIKVSDGNNNDNNASQNPKNSAPQNPKNIPNTFGNMIAWVKNSDSTNSDIANNNMYQFLLMYLRLAEAPYKGYSVEYRIYKFNPNDNCGKSSIESLKNFRLSSDDALTGMEGASGEILGLVINNQPIGTYFSKWKAFVPSDNFVKREYEAAIATEVIVNATDTTINTAKVISDATDNFIKANPHIAKRCQAILTNIAAMNEKNNISCQVLASALAKLGGALSAADMAVYEAEFAETVPEDIATYIHTTSGKNTDVNAVLGYMGTMGTNDNTDKLCDFPTLLNVGNGDLMDIHPFLQPISTNDATLVLIPPVKKIETIEHVKYEIGHIDSESFIPEWVDFTATLDGVLYHKVYHNISQIYKPDNVVDMAFKVPDGILGKYNYFIQASPVSALPNEYKGTWNFIPNDPNAIEIALTSSQYNGSAWRILQRSIKIEKLELVDGGKILGTIPTFAADTVTTSNSTAYISIDPAGSESVRLLYTTATNKGDAIDSSDITHPITPMTNGDYIKIPERYIASSSKSTHFDSLLQIFNQSNTTTGYNELMVTNRLWTPDENAMFQALKSSTDSMITQMNAMGVFSNMKELLTRSDLNPNYKGEVDLALRKYIGSLMLEAIIAVSKEGYSLQATNLKVLVSYPENNSGGGFTETIQSAIDGAIAFVNEYLAPANQLVFGNNLTKYSEATAADYWHQINSPDATFIGTGTAVGTVDIGFSTHDFALRTSNSKLYTFSVPYAAKHITNATLANVYQGNIKGLMDCFKGGAQTVRTDAATALTATMKEVTKNLHDSLGFTLTLSRLFNKCNFNITSGNANINQQLIQELCEMKLNVAIPAYASCFINAIKNRDLKLNDAVFLAPVGKGSLAINNVLSDYEARFSVRLKNEINHLLQIDPNIPLNTEYTGNIKILHNNDTNKVSVAQGMIDLSTAANPMQSTVVKTTAKPVEHYLDLAYGDDDTEKNKCRNTLSSFSAPSTLESYNNAYNALCANAFNELVEHYTFDKFQEAFKRFGYTSTRDGELDAKISAYVQNHFTNLLPQLKSEGKELVMACPGVEPEMMCSAIISIVLSRIDFSNTTQGGSYASSDTSC